MAKTQMPKGQKPAFHNDNPRGNSGVKNARNTGVSSSGTRQLRSNQYGKREGSDKVSNA